MNKRPEMPFPNRELIDFFTISAILSGVGGMIRSLKNGQGFWSSFLNSCIAGFFMLGIGGILKGFGASDNIILFSSGIVGVNANFVLNWSYRLLSAAFDRLQKYINPDFENRDDDL